MKLIKTVFIIAIVISGLVYMAGRQQNTNSDQVNEPKQAKESNDAKLTAIARQKCEERIKSYVKNPATLEINHITGYASKRSEKFDAILVKQTFSAKNDFNVEKQFTAFCSLFKDNTLDFYVKDGYQ